MIKLQETTEWEWPNHTYLVSTNKQQCFGYIKQGETEPFMFSKPLRFDTRNRSFKEVR